MEPYYVLSWDFNSKSVEYFDIMPYLMSCYSKLKSKPKSVEDIKKFILTESKYQFWARCQYEIVITGFPVQDRQVKLDVYDQIEMNIDIITKHFITQL